MNIMPTLQNGLIFYGAWWHLDDLRSIMSIQLSRKERRPVAVIGVLW